MPSIYRPNDPTGANADARSGEGRTADAPADRSGAADDQSIWAGRRKAQPASVLLPATQRWLDALPPDHRPLALVAEFPRIVNLVALNWGNPRDCSAFIASLLHDQRGGRRGFSAPVARDILNLRIYYARLHPIVDWSATEGHSDFWKLPGPKR